MSEQEPRPEDTVSATADTEAEAQPVAEQAVAPPPVTMAAARRSWLSLIVTVLLLALGGAQYYWLTRVHAPQMNQLKARMLAAGASRAEITRGLEQRGADIEAMYTEQDTLRQQVGRALKAQTVLEDSAKALYAKESEASLDWVLAEAEYLILAATQRIVLERDLRTAIAALQAADARLASARHPDLIPIREQLAKDIAALEGVNLPDVEGIAIYLAETIERVGDLPTKPIAELDTSFSSLRAEPTTAENWRGLAQALWSDLVSLIEIKDGDLPDGVLFDPELSYFLQQNLRLELASARLAALRRDNDNFRAASRLIVDFLRTYYNTGEAAVNSILARLEDAADIDFDPAVPDIAGSLDEVRAQRLGQHDGGSAGGVVVRDAP